MLVRNRLPQHVDSLPLQVASTLLHPWVGRGTRRVYFYKNNNKQNKTKPPNAFFEVSGFGMNPSVDQCLSRGLTGFINTVSPMLLQYKIFQVTGPRAMITCSQHSSVKNDIFFFGSFQLLLVKVHARQHSISRFLTSVGKLSFSPYFGLGSEWFVLQ